MEAISTIKQCLDALHEIQRYLASLDTKNVSLVGATEYTALSYLEEFTNLRSLLNTADWPYAVNPAFLCSRESDNDKFNRAEGILEALVVKSVAGLRFLDFGCGEGHVVSVAARQGATVAVGYERRPFKSTPWQKSQGVFTTDFEEVKKKGPYDVVLLYDVLDHLIDADPVEILKQLGDTLSEGGIIVLRCHPWSSRHGAHQYHSKNKAYAHLIFNPEELTKLGIDVDDPPIKVIYPNQTYATWIKRAGLLIASTDTTITKVEDFFVHSKLMKAKLNRVWDHPETEDLPLTQMERSFMDFILKR